jgi:hypothetical protein
MFLPPIDAQRLSASCGVKDELGHLQQQASYQAPVHNS